MIEIILLSVGFFGGLALGYVFGHRRGFVTGAKTAPLLPADEAVIFESHVTPKRCSVSHEVDIPPFSSPDLKGALLASAEHEMQRDLLDYLMKFGYLSPTIVYDAYSNSGFERIRLELSLLVAKDIPPEDSKIPYEKPKIYKVNLPSKDCKQGL
ncbi:hypothetical protein [Duncaniella muris]|jgi:hypothetical protein|uniref:hypothetical protein n=1 Tax=Duncaniella muris TaxID=2094150 RepID=UPI0026757FAC|nr:hypothetical protein [Duncaniella muris]